MRTNPEVASNAEAISNLQPSANRTRQALPASEAIRQWTAEIQIELVSAVHDQASAWHRGTRGAQGANPITLYSGPFTAEYMFFILSASSIERPRNGGEEAEASRSAAASPWMRRGLFKRQQAR